MPSRSLRAVEPDQRVGVDGLPARERAGDRIHVIVETPAGSRNKFKYDEALGLFRLHKMLQRGARFPFDFGFIPGTRGQDGDPLDVLVLAEESISQGCLVTVRLLGILEAEQTERGETIRNDRLIGVPETEKIRPTARSLADLPARLVDEVEHFFVSYNRAEGREFKPLRRAGPVVAAKAVDRGVRAHGRKPAS